MQALFLNVIPSVNLQHVITQKNLHHSPNFESSDFNSVYIYNLCT